MILNRTWYEGTYDLNAEPGTGPRFFLGGAAVDRYSPVVVVGGVETGDGWLLFAQSPDLYAPPDRDGDAPPRSLEGFAASTGEVGDLIMAIIFADAPGWEWDVVAEGQTGADGYANHRLPEMPVAAAKEALWRWVSTHDRAQLTEHETFHTSND